VSARLFIAVSPGEIWAALGDEGELKALQLLRTGAPSQIGAIILGRVVALRPELPAALVEIGLDRPGFLDARDYDRKKGLAGVTEGQSLILEVVKDARADKAAGLRALRVAGEVRAAIEAAAQKAKPPARLQNPPPPIATLLQEFSKLALERIVVDDRAALAEARAFLARHNPALAERLELHKDPAPIFEEAGLAVAIDEALSPRVALPGGGALIIEPTHAATMIDVDGGPASALQANLAAAKAVGRQIQLRNLAGPIVVDFVTLKKRADRDKVWAALKAALADDREKPELLGWTRLGHIELVRRRRLPSLMESLGERSADGAWRKTALTVALEALRAVHRAAKLQPGRAPAVILHPEIAAALGEGAGLAARQALEQRLGEALAIESQPSRARDSFDIRPRSPI